MNNELVRKEDRHHRDEMNLLEFPIGVISDRVPINPATGREIDEIEFKRTIVDRGEPKEQKWLVRGDPRYGGLLRGSDLDAFTALMTLWGRSDFQHRIISLGSIYSVLKTAGKSDQGANYKRFHRSIDRMYGLSIEAYNAIYDSKEQRRLPRFRFRLLSSDTLKETDETVAPRGLVHVTDEFYSLVALGYLKFTDIERYWRLPTTYSRRLFQYLDKHRRRALQEHKGVFDINVYLLAKKLGTLDQTLRAYSPNKLRAIMDTHLEALQNDGYPIEYRWKKEGKGRAPIVLEVTYAPEPPASSVRVLTDAEVEAIAFITRILDEPGNQAYFGRVVRDIGAGRACRILEDVEARAKAAPATHKGKLFTYLAEQQRHRGSPRRRLQ